MTMRRSLRLIPAEITGLILSLLVLVPMYFVVDNSLKPKAEAAQLTLRLPTVVRAIDNYRQVVVEGAVHGPTGMAPWYGSDGPLDAWWPTALAAWREALRYRASH